ncbi:hypothetical protein, partial [Pseudomonas syringae group genomosp. 7]|uniref:hypothetical protein n=1 Tax=Pseudomonas syringae group genomosp. 7 TaxID=251699 RepID=UPI00376F8F90
TCCCTHRSAHHRLYPQRPEGKHSEGVAGRGGFTSPPRGGTGWGGVVVCGGRVFGVGLRRVGRRGVVGGGGVVWVRCCGWVCLWCWVWFGGGGSLGSGWGWGEVGWWCGWGCGGGCVCCCGVCVV